ncbi:MAG: PKD domain-containing protein [Candidatus Omnitrophica bacterium]|nr:PKD domain-containing protein [Candidatus Omnitrophota bacterium]
MTPNELHVDDFNDGTKPNLLGGDMGVFDSQDGSSCMTTYIDNPGIVLGGWGYSMQLDYDVLYGSSFAGYWTAFNNMDLSMYNTLEFWIRGAAGGEKFTFYLKDFHGNESKLDIANYLPDGITTSWQKVTIPLSDFKGIVTWNEMDSFVITFEGMIGSGQGRIYIDNIRFVSGYIPIDNFDAAMPLNTPGSPYWSFANGAAIQAGYISDGAYGGDGYSLKITYDGVTPDTSCGWILTLGGIDASNLNMLGFYAKGLVGGEYFNVYLSDGSKRVCVDIRDYLTLENDWHYVKIALNDFAKQGLDLSNLERLEIVFEWKTMEGTIYIDNIEFSNKLFKEPSIGPVRTIGQNLLVRGKLFTVRGVGYQPTPIGYYPYDKGDGSPYMDVFADTPYNRDMWSRDFAYLRNMGCNTIRTWGKVTNRAFLDASYNNGTSPVYVIMGIWLDYTKDYSIPENRRQAIAEFAQYVQTYKDHPAVLAWAIGNEDNYWYAGVMKGLYTLINEMARKAYEIEGPTYHPVMFPSRDLLYIGDESVRAEDTAMNYLDIWAANTYRGSSFGDLFIDYQFRSIKPLLISEYGIDAWDNIASTEYENTQASCAVNLWNEIAANLNFCIGGTIMEYSDEWWKDDDLGSAPDSHDYGGYEDEAHPDGFSNEEWWGIMRPVDNGPYPNLNIMEPRQAYYDLKDKWVKDFLIDDFNDGTDPNIVGGATSTYATTGATCSRSYYNENPANVLGGSGYSVKIAYNITGVGSYGSFNCALQNLDARKYSTLSFWVKGQTGGEIFKVGLKDFASHETKIMITDYLLRGVTTEWQKVSIPFAAFRAVTDWDKLSNLSLIFEQTIGSGTGVIYIDSVTLDEKPASLYVDNFNDNIATNALSGPNYVWGSGASITPGYETTNPFGGSGKSLYITYNVPSGAWCGWTAALNGVNVSSEDTLTFYIKGAVGGERPDIGLKEHNDSGGTSCQLDLESYITVSTNWQRVNIPLLDFKNKNMNLDLTNLVEVKFVFNVPMSGTIYIDNIAFVNYSTSITPTLNQVPEVTNATPIALSGDKASGTSIVINGAEVIPLNEETNWSYNYPLATGSNIVVLSAQDKDYNESEAIVVAVALDPEFPTAYAGSDQTVFKDDTVYFDGSLSHDNSGIAIYRWNFGDGSPEQDGAQVSHVYAASGVYTVTLSVWDLGGNGPAIDELIVTVEDDTVVKIGGPNPDYATIQEGINNAPTGYVIYVYSGEYVGDLIIPEERAGIIIRGEDRLTTIIKGNITLTETSATIRDVSILYNEGAQINYSSDHYFDLKLLTDAGITVIDSEVSVISCIIKPNPDIFAETFGKGIQVWNMYESSDKYPTIENNLIMNTDVGVNLFSQAFGGQILGQIRNNTFVANDCGILLRMHKENPLIQDNIITDSSDSGVHITYEDGTLLSNRIVNIVGNDFYNNTHDIWCDAIQEERTPVPGNLYEYPDFDVDYISQNPACEGKGYSLP